MRGQVMEDFNLKIDLDVVVRYLVQIISNCYAVKKKNNLL